MLFLLPLAVLVLATAWVDAITLAGIICGSLMGMLTLVAYIARQVRRGVRLLDAVTEDMPKRLDNLERQRAADRTEMLSAVAVLGDKVDALAGQVQAVAEQHAADHEQIEQLARHQAA